jgi:ABC-2 type transport system permease protein
MRYMAPGLIASFLQLALMLAGGSLLPDGWRHSPCARRELLGRALPWFFGLGGVAMLGLLWLVQHTGYALPAVPATLGIGALLMAASLITGAAFSRIFTNIHKSAQMLLAFNAPAFLLSGYAFPEWAFPPVLEALTRPLPFSLFVDAWLAISGGPQGKGLSGVLGLSCYVLIPLIILALPRRHPLLAPHARPVHQIDTRRRTPWHELRSALSTPGLSLLFAVALPSYLIIYGSVYAHKEELKLPLAVTGALNSEASRLLARKLDAHHRLHVLPMSEPEANEAMRLGTVHGILHVPDNLGWRLHHRQATAIPLEVHADRLLPVGDIQRAVGEVTQAQSAAINAEVFMQAGLNPAAAKERAMPIVIDDHPAFNPLETYGDYMLPFLGALILHQVLLIASAYASAYRAPSVTRWIAYVFWFSAWMSIWMGFGLYVFDVPNEANWAGVAALCFLGIGAAACLGMTLGTLLKHELPVLQLLAFSSYPFFFLSGSSWPREMMPPFMQVLGDLIPLTPLCTGLNRAYRMGADFSQLRPELIHLSALLIGYGFIAWLTRHFIVLGDTRRGVQPSTA